MGHFDCRSRALAFSVREGDGLYRLVPVLHPLCGDVVVVFVTAFSHSVKRRSYCEFVQNLVCGPSCYVWRIVYGACMAGGLAGYVLPFRRDLPSRTVVPSQLFGSSFPTAVRLWVISCAVEQF